MHPSPRGLAVAATGIALAVLPAVGLPILWPIWLVFWIALVVLFGADAFFTVGASGLEVDLAMADTLGVGAPKDAVLTLKARSRIGALADLAVDLSENLEPQPTQRGRIGRHGTAFRVALVPLRRGPAELERAWVRTTGPLGLVARVVRCPLDRTCRIVHDIPGVRSQALRFWSSRSTDAGLKIERFVGDGSEFDSLRDFQPGFDRRSVDWKASARHTRLLSREFRAERSHQVVLAIDTGRLMAEPLEGVPRLDHAVHAALLLAYCSAKVGDRVSLFAFDERPRCWLPPRAGAAAFRAVLHQGGGLDYTTAETNFTLGLTELLSRLTRRSLVIVFTDFVDTVTAALMLDNVRRLARKHLVVFVALRDPGLGAITSVEPRSMRDVDRAVVAGSLVRERDLVLKKLGRLGVHCVEAVPSRIGVDLVNRYLEIKRRELVG